MSNSQPGSVMSQVEKVEEAMKNCFHRLDVLERKLKSKHLDDEQRTTLEKELDNVKSLLKQQEDDLKKLRTENSKSFMVAAVLMFVAFLVFGLYSMFFK
ncbi:hypothetical protein B566_EDAN002605 [Ephemera danica]|nr:hypothetical protein B566_EDAN002605 [Ephemera danica]